MDGGAKGWGDGCGARAGREAREPLTSHNAVHRVWRENSEPEPEARERSQMTPQDPSYDQPYDQGPVAALRRVAFLMERGREETRRVQAFRNAAATILPLAEPARWPRAWRPGP